MSQTWSIRPCGDEDLEKLHAVINTAAEAYRGVIPPDCWHEPYMSREHLGDEIAAGVTLWGYEQACGLIGVMGIQAVRDVHLIRHAYVAPEHQGNGVGSTLLRHVLSTLTEGTVLVGTWADAEWAIRFYRRHGFKSIDPHRTDQMLQSYWDIPRRQIETSVVLVKDRS